MLPFRLPHPRKKPLKPKLPLPPLISHRSPARQPICPGEEGETVEDVEEFFDEEDAEDEEPPVTEE